MTIIGIRPSSFKGDQGDTVTGMNIYLSYPLDKGTGQGCERVFLTDAKLNKGGYAPQVGDEVRLEYNKYGKCSAVYPED